MHILFNIFWCTHYVKIMNVTFVGRFLTLDVFFVFYYCIMRVIFYFTVILFVCTTLKCHHAGYPVSGCSSIRTSGIEEVKF